MNSHYSKTNGTRKDPTGLKTESVVLCYLVLVDLGKKKTGYYIPTYQAYTMTQVGLSNQMNTPDNFVIKYAPYVIRAIQIMALTLTITLMVMFVSAFPISITILFLALPALIMNIGWLMFSQAL